MEILKGHRSPETAYVVNDYPYGFRLRCKIRYWLEEHPTHGTRFVSQTTNPKRPGEFWNKPKPSTYARFAGCLYLNEEGHILWTGLTEYNTADEAQQWLDTWCEGLSYDEIGKCEWFIRRKRAYEEKRKEIRNVTTTA